MLLKLDNIGKIYNSDDILVVGIRGVNLEFDYNEFVTIEGESGAGKSTLLNIIGANDSYEEGELWFDGQETSHFSEEEWEEYRENNIATVFQDFNIIENLTVLENIELALFRLDDKKERRKVALELIEKVGLKNQANQRASKLSGGEKQRTVIARALAKDSPIILADEPTGNLDVKASREVAKLLKDVSKDKLVIVVTHNPEFFKEYATRRVRVYDGKVTEDIKVKEVKDVSFCKLKYEKKTTRLQNLKNTFYIGILNYKSRPKFTAMMSFALFVCAITLFMIMSVFKNGIISDVKTTVDKVCIDGKVIVSTGDKDITPEKLDDIAHIVDASYILYDRRLSLFDVYIPKQDKMMSDYTVTCVFDPINNYVEKGEIKAKIPFSLKNDHKNIVDTFINAEVGIEKANIEYTVQENKITIYFSSYDLNENGKKIKAINSDMKFGENTRTVYTFRVNESIQEGYINIVNSVYYNIVDKSVIFKTKLDKSYIVENDSEKDSKIDGVIVEMNKDDYNLMFSNSKTVLQSCLYFDNGKLAERAVDKLPEGYMGMLSNSNRFVKNAGDVYTMNVTSHIGLIFLSILFGMLIVVIFMRSVKIYQQDFTVYKTLGISRKISSLSLYMEMAFIFAPTLILLPLVSLISTIFPGSTLTFITLGNYLFIEFMLLIIVEMVAFSFNRSISRQSIRKSLKRGSK